MNKIKLSEIGLYYGQIEMPKGFEINREKLSKDIIFSITENKQFPFSRDWDMLQKYLIEHINLEYNFYLLPKYSFGNIYKPKEHSIPLMQINFADLKNSPDYVMLYGVDVDKDSCDVCIEYDDNRRKGKIWKISLDNNKFIMFPASQRYYITKNKSDQSNFILTTTYEYV